jgi:hypothetical protein
VDEQNAAEIDTMMGERRRIRYEWWRNPDDPFSGFGGTCAQRRQGRHQQPELTHPVMLDKNLADTRQRPAAAGQITIERIEPRCNRGCTGETGTLPPPQQGVRQEVLNGHKIY